MIKVLVIWHSDRIERREVLDLLIFLREVKSAGGRVESVKEGLLDGNNLTTLVTGWTNHQKSEHLSDQVQLAHNRIRENGAFRGRDPFGYEITGTKYNKRLVVIESLRPIVAEIFDRVIAGQSLADVCTWLDSLKVKRSKTTGELTPWWPAMLMRLIRHPAYSGTYYVKRTDATTGKLVTYAHKCERIVSSRTQREAIAAMKTRGRFGTDKRGPRGNPETRAMLKGVITCGNPDCDATGAHPSPMYRLTGRLAGGRAEYYYCQGRGAQRHGCGNLVLMADVDQAVNKIIAETFAVPVTEQVLIKGHDWSDEIDAAKGEIRALDLDDEDYDRRHAELRAELERLKALPAEPDEWRESELDELWSDVYETTERSERGAWLKAHGFTVTASKSAVFVARGEISRTVTLS